MSADNVETIKRWFDALEQGDPAPEMCDPEIEIRNWAESPIPGPYVGLEGVRHWWDDVSEAFDDVHLKLLDLEPIDDVRCLTVQRLIGKFRLTGIEVSGAWGAIISVREGKILSAIGYATPRHARRAAGLD